MHIPQIPKTPSRVTKTPTKPWFPWFCGLNPDIIYSQYVLFSEVPTIVWESVKCGPNWKSSRINNTPIPESAVGDEVSQNIDVINLRDCAHVEQPGVQ